jgi:oligosaccharide reducing-end xylanase
MPGRGPRVVFAASLFALASCYRTSDSVGYNAMGGVHLRPVTGPASYPNPFKDLGKTDTEVATKIANTFNQLFYGDPQSQAIYFPSGDQASINDILHGDIRTEGIGLGMMICVQLDKRAEFDRLWAFANAQMKQTTGPRRGYFESSCDASSTTTAPCVDPYGEAQLVTALIFAHDRWGSTTTANYEAGAIDLLTVMLHKQDENGGIVDSVTNTFDTTTALPFDVPTTASAGIGRPSIVMPAYYDLWAQATADPFWTRAAASARDYWKKVAHATTGLMPVRATFAGEPVFGWDTFQSEVYRAQVNMALDWAWAKSEPDPWVVDEANLLLKFFSMKGIDSYGTSYKLDGMLVDGTRDQALIAVNGVTAMVSINLDRAAYVNALWDMFTPIGPARYYSGILELTALLILSGQYRVW